VVLVKTVKVSAKGQITLPVEALRAMKARKGTELLLVQQGDHLVLVRAGDVGKRVLDELGGFEALAAPAFADLWDNPADEVWDEA
jgi:bifunctional DNA-binding transcriptional regulator/antitoxin component of YhaV-PrlF toxin-antitoxin module